MECEVPHATARRSVAYLSHIFSFSMFTSRINIGVYGTTGAGKTRFFWQLVKGAKLPVAPGSRLADFMKAATDPDGKIVPTTANCENIELKVGSRFFLVNDSQGKVLSESLGNLDAEHRHGYWWNPMAKLIQRSNAILFFFDPTAETVPHRTAKHFNDELLRAKQLIDVMLDLRQNRLLPIVFVLTHHDHLTAEQSALVEKWIDEVDEHLVGAYAKILRQYFPPQLVRKENIFQHVSSDGAEHVDEHLAVLGKVRSLVEIADRFRRLDRRRSLRLIGMFLLAMLLIFGVPFACWSSPRIRQSLLDFCDKNFPGLRLAGELTPANDAAELDSLLNGSGEISETEAKTQNRSLTPLMKNLNRLEDLGKQGTEDYQKGVAQWTKAWETIRRRFDADTAPRRLERYGALLNGLVDSPKRQPPILDGMLKDYWTAYRTRLLDELRNEIKMQRDVGTPSPQLLAELCTKLETAFRDVAESNVRGDVLSHGTDDGSQKEALKQEIRKAFISCRNYRDRVPLEIVVESASLESISEIDRDIHRRLVFLGGQEKGEVFVDLAISTGYQSNTSCVFLPSRKDFTVSFVPDQRLRVVLQGKPKGSQGEWSEIIDWDVAAQSPLDFSLAPLGIPFYRQFENEENTAYPLFGSGYKLELTIRRPRNVPELLWEIVGTSKK